MKMANLLYQQYYYCYKSLGLVILIFYNFFIAGFIICYETRGNMVTCKEVFKSSIMYAPISVFVVSV